MGFLDERIALLEREERKLKKKTAAGETGMAKPDISYTTEFFKIGFKRGLTFVDYKQLSIEIHSFLAGRIQMPFITDFFEIVEEQEDAICLESKKHGVSATMALVPQKQARKPIEEWEKALFSSMRKSSLFCQGIKKAELEHLDYVCYEVPTIEGKLYHITFFLIEEEYYLSGTFNCNSQERESMGILLEAIVQEISSQSSSSKQEET